MWITIERPRTAPDKAKTRNSIKKKVIDLDKYEFIRENNNIKLIISSTIKFLMKCWVFEKILRRPTITAKDNINSI